MYPPYNNNNNMFFSKKSLAEKKKKKSLIPRVVAWLKLKSTGLSSTPSTAKKNMIPFCSTQMFHK
jgi:hypothetical protein